MKRLWLMSCAHIGEDAHNKKEFGRYLAWAKKTGAEICIMGDLMDTGLCFGTKHIGSVWNNNMSPQEQIDEAVACLKPLAGRIRAIVKGNHEVRAENLTSINPLRQVADRLCVSYQDANTVVTWEGRRIFVAHGTSAGYLTDFKKVLDAYEGLDVVALGHTHAMYAEPIRRFSVDAAGHVRSKEIYLVRCGNFLTDASYAKFAGYRPTPTGSPILEVEGGHLNVRLGL